MCRSSAAAPPRMVGCAGGCLLLVVLATLAGCAPGGYFGRASVAESVACRTGHDLPPCDAAACASCAAWPAQVDLRDGLNEDEAATLALWRNPRFQELLAQLGVTWADLEQAGQIANPQLWAVFPVGPKQWEFAVAMPLEALLLRHQRVELAEIDSRRVAQQLVQEALNTIFTARQAHADVLLAQERLGTWRQSLTRRGELARQAESRLRAGDVSQLDVATTAIFHQRGQIDAHRAAQDLELARQRLATVLALDVLRCPPVVGEPLPRLAAAPPGDVAGLIECSLASRPDLLSAADAVAAADARAKLTHYDFIVFQVILPDYNSQGIKGSEAGPGLNLTLPIFNQNQAAIARAQADLEIARRRYATLQAAVAQEVAQSHERLLQARDEWLSLGQKIEPCAAAAYESATRAYVERATTLPMVLELARQLDEAQLRRVQLVADMRTMAADLERSTGGRPCLEQAAGAARSTAEIRR